MFRRLLRILDRTLTISLTILSLVLFLATVTLWARSYWRGDYLRTGFHAGWRVESEQGQIRVARFEDSRVRGISDYYAETRTPLWLPAILFAILPALKLRAILRARKQTRGFEVITKPARSE